MATVVDTGTLLRTVAASFVAGVGVTLLFSLAILAAARFADLSRDGRRAAAVWIGVLAVVALTAAAAGVAIGIIVIISN